MVDLTESQRIEYYGPDRKPSDWKPDFTKWVAVLWSGDEEDEDDDGICWCVTPKIFWDANGCIPDRTLGFSIPGFVEVIGHNLDSVNSIVSQRTVLVALGFDVLDSPQWWFDRIDNRQKQEKKMKNFRIDYIPASVQKEIAEDSGCSLVTVEQVISRLQMIASREDQKIKDLEIRQKALGKLTDEEIRVLGLRD